MRTAIVFSCAHSSPDVPNDRFDWLGKLLYDVKPDYVIDLGDIADMKSLNSFDTRYPQQIVNQNYEKDIKHYLDSQERIRHPFKANKKKKPYFIGIEGNHENRIKKAISHDPRLEGPSYGISFSHLETKSFYDEYHEYENSAPAIIDVDGVDYSHFFSSGSLGKPISAKHHGLAILDKRRRSATCGHAHTRNIHFLDGVGGGSHIGLLAGCFKGREEPWAGQANRSWWSGVIIKRDIDNGIYDPEFVSLARLRKAYG